MRCSYLRRMIPRWWPSGLNLKKVPTQECASVFRHVTRSATGWRFFFFFLWLKTFLFLGTLTNRHVSNLCLTVSSPLAVRKCASVSVCCSNVDWLTAAERWVRGVSQRIVISYIWDCTGAWMFMTCCVALIQKLKWILMCVIWFPERHPSPLCL